MVKPSMYRVAIRYGYYDYDPDTDEVYIKWDKWEKTGLLNHISLRGKVPDHCKAGLKDALKVLDIRGPGARLTISVAGTNRKGKQCHSILLRAS